MFGVDVDDEVVVGRDEAAVLQFEEDVGGGVVDGGDGPDDQIVGHSVGAAFVGHSVGGGFSGVIVDDGEAHEGRQGEVVVGLFGECAWEKDVATGEFLCALLGVDVAEFNETDCVVAETVFLDEEGYEDAV